MLEQRLSKIDFAGLDGFNWFIGQVTTDPNWREQCEENGYRAKVRIVGHHPPDKEIPDSELPWAVFAPAPNFGLGNNYAGQSFCLQGGETVMGFFLDGEERQQPVVFMGLPQGPFVSDPIPYEKAFDEKTSMFSTISFKQAYDYGAHIKLTGDKQPNHKGGFLDSNNEIIDKNGVRSETHIEKVNNEKIELQKAKKCTKAQQALSDAIKDMKGIIKYVERLEPTPNGGYIDNIFNIPVSKEDFDFSLQKVSEKISGAMSINIRLAKAEMMKDINDSVDDMLKFTEPDFLLKKLKIDDKKNELSCLFENIIGGLSKTIKDMLKQALGKLVSLPLCAAENLIGGLISDITDKISKAIGPALNGITGILSSLNPMGGVSGLPDFTSTMKKALKFAQAGLKLFTCEGQECEEDPDDWDINVGPDGLVKPDLDRIGKISDSMNVLSIGKNLAETAFPGLKNVKNPFTGISSSIDGLGTTAQQRLLEMQIEDPEAMALLDEVGGCDGADGPFGKRCGPPKVQFFGGEGFGAFGKAVVNNIGEIIGVSMSDLGFDYTIPPLVTFIDECENGQGASGKAIIEDGKVIKVVMQESGSGYLGGGVSDGDGEQVIAVLDGIDVVGTGVGYEEGDTITTDDGQVLEPIIQDGRIIGANPLDVRDGISDLPDLTINTNTGFGAIIRPSLNFVKVEDYEKPILPSTQVIQVIDCVSSY
tara:strand:- start:587 stop:2698 length:2112 start_codon:yes stop_codon:yes gene_type:complete